MRASSRRLLLSEQAVSWQELTTAHNGSRFARTDGDVLRPQNPDSRLRFFAVRHG